jgi:hypothetical protein
MVSNMLASNIVERGFESCLRQSKDYKISVVKSVLRSHLWEIKNGLLRRTGDLKKGSIHMKFSMTGQDKSGLFNTGDCLIQVTTWAGLTVCCFYTKYTVLKSNSKD